jgi:hypothetical protein
MTLAMNTKIQKAELLEIVKKNREAHVAEVKKAREQWKTKMVRMAKLIVEAGPKLRRFPKALEALDQVPQSHARDFDDAIRALELHHDDIIELSPHNFEQLVLNRWSWSDSHVYMNFAYGVTGATGPTGDTGSTGQSGNAALDEIPDEIVTDFAKGELE